MSMGVVSSIARQMRPDDPMAYIQTDAPINPGSSGGPLLDTHGHVVGINTFIYSQSGGSQGLGFAVPSNIVVNVLSQIRKNGRVIRGLIGVNDYTITPVLAQGLNLPQESGVLLADVYPDSPAEKAGLKPLDIVLTLDGKRMENARQFDVGIYARSEGDVVKVEVLRGREKLLIPVTVMARQETVDLFSGMVSVSKNSVRKLNILGISLTQKVAEMLPDLRSQYGVLVAAKTFDPLVQEIDLEIGDVITAINGNPVSSLEALRAALEPMKLGDPVVLHVERGGKVMLLSFEYE
jgi:serine protease Do